jgi:restriction endonuclease Mrr
MHQPTEVQNMITRIEQFADNLKAESRLLADRAVAGLRTAGLETAGLLTRTKRPVHAIADTGLKLNALSHKSIEKLLKQQVAVFDDFVEGSARRLEMAAHARSVKTLVDSQLSTLPQSRDHVVKNARKTAAIVRDTGDAFSHLVKDVVVDISSARKPARKKAAGRPAARKKAPGRKPAARKTAAKKTAAKKRTARKAPASKAATSSAQAA